MKNWIFRNAFFVALLLLVVFVGIGYSKRMTGERQNLSFPSDVADSYAGSKIAMPALGMPAPDYAPAPEVSNRLVLQESNVSLLVKDVVDTRNKILDYTNSLGGYMVNVTTSNPQDAPTATISIRIPSDKLQSALDYFRTNAIKVVSENLMGHDVTDQYVDIEKRIQLLENTKARYEDILQHASQVSDITNLTNQILQTQNQIDSYKGQKDALQKNAQLARLTVYLSTDEIALPYAPSETFRPAVIFKLAVRSLIATLRDAAKFAIWVGVYAVIWVPALLALLFFRNRTHNIR